jgi:hypothetical protein
MGFSLPLIVGALVGGISGLSLLILCGLDRRWFFLTLTIMLVLSSIGPVFQGDYSRYGTVTPNVLQPIAEARSFLFPATGMLMGAAFLLVSKRLAPARPSALSAIMVVLGFFISIMEAYHTSPESGLATLGVVLTTTLIAAIVLPRLMGNDDDWWWLLRAVAIAGAPWAFFVMFQTLVDVRGVQLGSSSRFRGIASNPQQAAVYLAITTGFIFFLVMNDPAKRWKTLWMALMPLTLGMLLWTGSRTGAAMFTMAAMAILFRRFGRFVLFAPALAVGAFVFMKIIAAAGVDLGIERLTSTHDTRSAAWGQMLIAARDNPALGVGVRSLVVSENSYLYLFAAYGILAFMLGLAILFGLLFRAIQLAMLYRGEQSPLRQRLIEFTIALIGMYCFSSFFEGYLAARISVMTIIGLLIMSMSSVLVRQCRAALASETYDDPVDSLEQERMEYLDYGDTEPETSRG